jgi:cytoplasmic iron level regulating protein YaaA (DUF328/UPF0246 family)
MNGRQMTDNTPAAVDAAMAGISGWLAALVDQTNALLREAEDIEVQNAETTAEIAEAYRLGMTHAEYTDWQDRQLQEYEAWICRGGSFPQIDIGPAAGPAQAHR